jgi:hypothetical protein
MEPRLKTGQTKAGLPGTDDQPNPDLMKSQKFVDPTLVGFPPREVGMICLEHFLDFIHPCISFLHAVLSVLAPSNRRICVEALSKGCIKMVLGRWMLKILLHTCPCVRWVLKRFKAPRTPKSSVFWPNWATISPKLYIQKPVCLCFRHGKNLAFQSS